MLHLVVISGLCNRLFAIISAMRYARETQQKLTIYWKTPVGRVGVPYEGDKVFKYEHVNCFFQAIPDVTLKTWVPNLIKQLEEEGATMLHDGSLIIPSCMPKDERGMPKFPPNFLDLIRKPLVIPKTENGIVNMPTTPFGFETDEMEKYRRYPEEPNQPRKKTQYELELSKFARKLKLIPTIQNVLNFQYRHLFNPYKKPRVGVHIRRTDLKTTITPGQLDLIMNEIHEKYQGHIIFVCSDDYQLQQKYVKLYGWRAYQEPIKTKNSIQGIQKALIDLYLLGCCDIILGTKCSSFSYYAWMLAKDDAIFEIHS